MLHWLLQQVHMQLRQHWRKCLPCQAPAAKHLCRVLVREIFALCSKMLFYFLKLPTSRTMKTTTDAWIALEEEEEGGMTMQCVLCLRRSRMRRKLMLNLTARIWMRILSFSSSMMLTYLSQTPTLDIGYVICI